MVKALAAALDGAVVARADIADPRSEIRALEATTDHRFAETQASIDARFARAEATYDLRFA